ncbi:MAG TPA: glutamine amidotransferase [Pirellulales bacterium]|nr:glutamine amidotransferase [Pirellulales bacterium]
MSRLLLANIVRLSVSPVGGPWVVALAIALLAALLWFGPSGSKLTPGRRRVLAALRLIVILLMALALLRPTIVRTKMTKQSATLIVLVDRSRSMLVTDAIGNKSRWEVVKGALGDSLPQLDKLAEDLEIKVYEFDSGLQKLDYQPQHLQLDEQPAGEQSAIGAAIDEAVKAEAGKRLSGVLLLSDGAQRAYPPHDMPPQLAARRLADLGCRLYAIPFGQARGPGQSRDAAIEDMLAAERVFVKNKLPVAGAVRLAGLENQQVAVQLLVETAPGKMEPVATRQLESRQDGEQLPVELVYPPKVPGEFKITLRAAEQPGELVTTNNEMSTFVTVLKGGVNVLYLDGSLSPEQKFLRWSLDASPDIKLDYIRIRADRNETRPPDLLERLKPGKYDVYMLGDLDSDAFDKEELEQLRATVEQGAGLIMMGGLHSFGAGGYGSTVLADVLPIMIGRFERQQFGENIREDLHLGGKTKMQPTAYGVSQFLMLLAPASDKEKNAAAWARLPPLEGANHFAGLKQGANVLAESDDRQPLLVASNFGNGRVLAFAGDSTWHWWMEGHEAEHKRFWRQVVLWLARKDESNEGRVWVKLDRRRHAPGSRVEFSAGANTAEGEPIVDGAFEAEVVRPDGKRIPVTLRKQGDEMRGAFLDAQDAGDYTVVVNVKHDSEPLGASQARFLVYDQDLELNNPAADVGALESLAAMTEGKSLAPEQLPSLLDELKAGAKSLEIETQSKETLWDRWPFFLIFVGVLALEWVLRKRWGLV